MGGGKIILLLLSRDAKVHAYYQQNSCIEIKDT